MNESRSARSSRDRDLSWIEPLVLSVGDVIEKLSAGVRLRSLMSW